MKILRLTQILGLASLMLLFVQCDEEVYLPDQDAAAKSANSGKAPSAETAGNNLSYPVLWADGIGKELRGEMNSYTLDGEWWYVWGEDPSEPGDDVYSCQPDPNNQNNCLDGFPPGDGVSVVYKAYVQKDLRNTWQAFNAVPNDKVYVDLIDWSDVLESVDFTLNSMVRAEVVLFEELDDETYTDVDAVGTPIDLPQYPQYPMRHVSGWGINEVHGLQTFNQADPEPVYEAVIPTDPSNYLATVYSHNARFTIQKLNVEVDDYDPELSLLDLTWDPGQGWTGDDINPPIFNMAVYQAGDGPGYYNAEINVKGKVIYGYTWKVRTLNEGEGYYRLTFSFDESGPGAATLNTYFDTDTTIIVSEDEEPAPELLALADAGGGTGGIAKIDVANQITYMDILINPKTKGGGGNNGNSDGSGNGTPGGGKGRK